MSRNSKHQCLDSVRLVAQATPTCSRPGEQVPHLIGPLAAVLQRCVNLNAAVSAQVCPSYRLPSQPSPLHVMALQHSSRNVLYLGGTCTFSHTVRLLTSRLPTCRQHAHWRTSTRQA